MATPEFADVFKELQEEHFKHIGRKMDSLLLKAFDTLHRMLSDPDWKARDAAIEKILRVHGRYIEQIAISGHVHYSGDVQHDHAHTLARSRRRR